MKLSGSREISQSKFTQELFFIPSSFFKLCLKEAASITKPNSIILTQSSHSQHYKDQHFLSSWFILTKDKSGGVVTLLYRQIKKRADLAKVQQEEDQMFQTMFPFSSSSSLPFALPPLQKCNQE